MATLKTFIVEDSPVILENLVSTLQELTHVEVIGCVPDEASAVQALHHAAEPADLYIVDVFLRSGTGLGVLQVARQLGLEARFVVLTNYATAEMRRRCLSLGAERVFDKSRDLDELIAYCAELCGEGTRPAPLS